MNKAGLLGFINMPHFGWLTKVNACFKQLLAFFHGGTLWLDTLVTIMVDLIANIMRLPKDGLYPSQYFRGKDNDKSIAMRLNKNYDS